MEPKMVQNQAQKERSEIEEKIDENRFENWIKMLCNFEHDFLRIFVDFGGYLGTQDGAKIEQKGYQKQERF